MTKHLVTGATGFLGSAIVLELLDRHPYDTVTCLIRGSAEGLTTHLWNCAAAYGRAGLGEHFASRVATITADVTDPRSLERITGRFDAVWHSAGSLRWDEQAREQTTAVNLGGTANMVALARRCQAQDFTYLSTAYVAGSTGRPAPEVPAAAQAARSPYEASKIGAEAVVLAAEGPRCRILRPSIVVGHSLTQAAPGTRAGFYGVVEILRRTARRGDPGPALLDFRDDAVTNMVPIDTVAREAVDLHQAKAFGIFHLTHPEPIGSQDAVLAIAEALGLPEPAFGTPTRPRDLAMRRYLDPFLRMVNHGGNRFERRNTDQHVQPIGHPVLGRRQARELAAWYLAQAG